MSEHNITVDSGTSLRLKTAGKYCDRDILVTATGGSGGSSKPEQEKTVDITENGTTEVTPDEGKVLSKVKVNVDVPDKYNEGYEVGFEEGYIDGKIDGQSQCEARHQPSKTIAENGTYSPDNGYTAISKVVVQVPIPEGYIKPSGTKEITENGTHDVTEYSSVDVNVPSSGGGDGNLPAGYSVVDFIEFNGSQMIDTGFIGNQDTEVNVCFTRENSLQRYLLGCASSDNTAALTIYLGGSWRFGSKSASKSVSTIHEKLTYTAIINKTNLTLSGAITSISGVSNFETIGTILLGGCRSSNGNLPTTLFSGKVFNFIMWQGGEQILKLVPVVSNEGIYRFFDMVSKTFFDSITDTPLGGGNV